MVNFFCSLFRGKIAGRNPWHSNTLEWTAPSPPPHGNFETPPIVYRGPYEYGVPDAEEDYLPQTAAHPERRAADRFSGCTDRGDASLKRRRMSD